MVLTDRLKQKNEPIASLFNMKRYKVILQFDSELEEQDIEQAMNDFLDNVEAADVSEDTDCYIEVVDEYPNFEDIEVDDD